MKPELTIIIEKDSEGFFVASVPELRGCHTQAKSVRVLLNRIREAIRLCQSAKRVKRKRQED